MASIGLNIYVLKIKAKDATSPLFQFNMQEIKEFFDDFVGYHLEWEHHHSSK